MPRHRPSLEPGTQEPDTNIPLDEQQRKSHLHRTSELAFTTDERLGT